ncbi:MULTISPECIES: saccharopine dehydrogenase family protein [Rhodococcus]|uniref:Saccharopine dehydrogenase NADP-binding domain-containing protein n=1 Tax=Rhodococcus oxybenzonivorans TaxID=1990687 RepID=A0AAE5A5L3_9NOCA|nr:MULTISPECIES: saccharopine dehydrogenase NADP-binding domain-containing protein [Rhodococcus]MDV7241677.1 saccharopine dehydrogenase NADP-binding domain-containing protein [Rhodococcus oxybenzonivorans]MDV7264712.1 saccharopine dehydrogenase NADP-binding domain-containing protein [Rhodococcus oxybenzonivorans]MDV7273789.1 saccharopine dehydrogenase NADP-binding domain-containing protein [Rhodococcus oxybenzonivorans]MDV7333959.1 saccharopine dehydrogenase NADP-binding domain-containing prote
MNPSQHHVSESGPTDRPRVLVYGIYGYTGALVGRESVCRGLNITVAGRDRARTEAAARDLGVPARVVALDDAAALDAALADIDIVAHCAGPYERTSAPMVDACLRTGTQYLDLTGEADVFESIYQRDSDARAAGIALVPGVGFDVVPTDHLAAVAILELPGATSADVAVISRGGFSRGTLTTALLGMAAGNKVRSEGRFVPTAHSHRIITVDLPGSRKTTVGSTPLGDLASAARTAGLRNVTTFTALPGAAMLRRFDVPMRRFLGLRGVGEALEKLLSAVPGPSEEARARTRSAGWVRLTDDAGRSVVRSIEVDNTYAFTAKSMVQAVFALSARPVVGALTPSQAFGADFIDTIPGVELIRGIVADVS